MQVNPNDMTFTKTIPPVPAGESVATVIEDATSEHYLAALDRLANESMPVELRGIVLIPGGSVVPTVVLDVPMKLVHPVLYRAVTERLIPEGADNSWVWTLYSDRDGEREPGAKTHPGVAVLRVIFDRDSPDAVSALFTFILPEQDNLLAMIALCEGRIIFCPMGEDIITRSIVVETSGESVAKLLIDAGYVGEGV